MKTEQRQYKYCLRCHRLLKSEESKAKGMGKTCWEKYLKEKQGKPLFKS